MPYARSTYVPRHYGFRKRITAVGYVRAPRTSGTRLVRRGRYNRFFKGYSRTGGFYGRFSKQKGCGAPELKFKDTAIDQTNVTADMTIKQLLTIPEGNGESNRIGRKICIKRISWRIRVQLQSDTDAIASTEALLRGMIILDTQTNGEEFTAVDLLDTDVWKSFNNLANSKRFKTLKKFEINLASGGNAQTAAGTWVTFPTFKYITGSIKVDLPIEYDNSATTGAITTIRSNNIYWTTQTVTDSTVNTVGQFRIRYSDN